VEYRASVNNGDGRVGLDMVERKLAIIIVVCFSIVLVIGSFFSGVTDPQRTHECCAWTDYGFHAPSDYSQRVDVNANCSEVYLDDCQRSVTDTICVPNDGRQWNESKSGECKPSNMILVSDVFGNPPLIVIVSTIGIMAVIMGILLKHPEWFD
jgi:hypothetical protein